jgi:Na+/H+ antiporter NhaD/arsenite permease-like protein
MLTPLIIRVTRRLELPPTPYLIGLATSANIGSVATIIGNPQNALIAVRSGMTLLPFAIRLWPVAFLGLVLDGALLSWLYRRRITARPLTVPEPRHSPEVHRWLLVASLASGVGMVVALAAGVRPSAAAMTAAAVVILAGATRPRESFRHVDWSLLLLFSGLFVVMRGVDHSGLAHAFLSRFWGPVTSEGAHLMAGLGAAVTVLSQAVSNVPAVMFFLPSVERLPEEAAARLWPALAAFSTLAGNLTIIGSVANVIVFETAKREGAEVGFGEYLRAGFPLTVGTLLIAWIILSLGGWHAQ